jgi:hypothetical protein
MRKISIITLAALCLATGAAVAQQGPGPARGSGAGQDQAMAKKQADCRRKADEKGLRGLAKRSQRQAFMQGCVHGE